MTAHEIFTRIPSTQATDILTWLFDKEKQVYKAAIETLAKQRHLPAIEALLEKHDPAVVRIYLNAFHALNDQSWKSLGELLETDDRLK